MYSDKNQKLDICEHCPYFNADIFAAFSKYGYRLVLATPLLNEGYRAWDLILRISTESKEIKMISFWAMHAPKSPALLCAVLRG